LGCSIEGKEIACKSNARKIAMGQKIEHERDEL
jgi:hypothetical protein